VAELKVENALSFEIDIDADHTLHAYVLNGELKHVGISNASDPAGDPEDLTFDELHGLSLAVDRMKKELQGRDISYGQA